MLKIPPMKKLSIVLLCLIGLSFIVVSQMPKLSTAKLSGTVTSPQIKADASLSRDAMGTASIIATSRQDAAFLTGYVHAQERFFQMDLLRRSSAGELAELFGPMAIEHDRKLRHYQLNQVARDAIKTLPAAQKQLLEMYTQGVNQGLHELSLLPPEYLLLGLKPREWEAKDSILVSLAMFLDLNDESAYKDLVRTLVRDQAAPSLAELLIVDNSSWEAPIVGHLDFMAPAIPEASVIDLRRLSAPQVTTNIPWLTEESIGSNSWAVNGQHTLDGRALLANDMHLAISVPSIWFHLDLNINDQKIVGVSLPGTPLVVAGSNNKIAWGFTNSYGDWSDLITLNIQEGHYQTNDGWLPITTIQDEILVKGQDAELIHIDTTHWGPIIHNYNGQAYATRWLGITPGALNLSLMDLEQAENINQGISACNSAGIPPQNCTLADSAGNIAWTIAGQIPERKDLEYREAINWAQADNSWGPWLKSIDYPKIINPEHGYIWTANSKVVSGDDLRKIGHSGYAIGARSTHIRDELLKMQSPDEFAMFRLAYDDRGFFFNRWHEQLLVLSNGSAEPLHSSAYELLNRWNGRASSDSQAFSIIYLYRKALIEDIFLRIGQWLQQESEWPLEADALLRLPNKEDIVWTISQAEPEHLLPPNTGSWQEYKLNILSDVLNQYWVADERSFAQMHWGKVNLKSTSHPMSRALPNYLSYIGLNFDMPDVEMSGSSHVPHVRRLGHGASEHLVIAPGHLEDALFNMPSGASGNPYSPYFGLGHYGWATGQSRGLLPTTAEYTLVFKAQAN